MSKLIVQLVHQGRPAWIAEEEVSPDVARKMSKEELKALVGRAREALEELVLRPSRKEPPPAEERETPNRKRR